MNDNAVVETERLEALLGRLNFASSIAHSARTQIFYLLREFNEAKAKGNEKITLSGDAMKELEWWQKIKDCTMRLGFGRIDSSTIWLKAYSDASSKLWSYVLHTSENGYIQSAHGTFTGENANEIILIKEAEAWLEAVKNTPERTQTIFYRV